MMNAQATRLLRGRPAAILQALFVTFLWSTSWVLIKIGVVSVPPLTFAGLRYFLAFLLLLPFLGRRPHRQLLRQLEGATWWRLIMLGVIYYFMTQGAQFVSLAYLPAITANVLLNFTPLMVAFIAFLLIGERPTGWQVVGMGLAIVGGLVYFFPLNLANTAAFGLLIAFLGMVANALSSVLGRAINRTRSLPPVVVTTISMGIGSLLLLATGLWWEGWPALTAGSWAIIGWLAVVNTAFAFTLWNHTLRSLTALESSIINNSMGVQIPLLAVIFLGELLTGRQWLGLAIAVAGVFWVQLSGRKSSQK